MQLRNVMTKEDLKTGMHTEHRDGSFRVVIKGRENDSDILYTDITDEDCCSLSSFGGDFKTLEQGKENLDIMAVYEEFDIHTVLELDIYGTKIWQRPLETQHLSIKGALKLLNELTGKNYILKNKNEYDDKTGFGFPKMGDKVILRDNSQYICFPFAGCGDLLGLNTSSCALFFSVFNRDLTHKGHSYFDIVKIQRCRDYTIDSLFYKEENVKWCTVWERKETILLEQMIKEIESITKKKILIINIL